MSLRQSDPSVLRILLEDNEAEQLHWFRKTDWNRRLLMFDAKFCDGKVETLKVS